MRCGQDGPDAKRPPAGRSARRCNLAGVGALLCALCAAQAQSAEGTATFRDCDVCPEMVIVPAGSFVMGSPAGERDRQPGEGPPRTVRIERAFAVSRNEVTRAQFAAFAQAVPLRQPVAGCVIYDSGKADFRLDESARDWRRPGYPQGEDHPVVCVGWNDAKAYAGWLSTRTGHSYRLLSEAEWEYAARAGSVTSRPWGDDPAQACRHANVADETFVTQISRTARSWYPGWHACRDGHAFTAPVGQYEANRFGLKDMIGNVWEWVEDCWSESYAGAPAGAGPRLTGDCSQRVYRGAAWRSYPLLGRSARRNKAAADLHHALIGIRVARVLENGRR